MVTTWTKEEQIKETIVFDVSLVSNRAADWNLGEPTWTGRMRAVAKGTSVLLKLEDKLSGALFANCPIDTYPGIFN